MEFYDYIINRNAAQENLALNEDQEFVSLTLLEDMNVRVQKLRNKGLNEWTFRGLFKTKAQLSRLIITRLQ